MLGPIAVTAGYEYLQTTRSIPHAARPAPQHRSDTYDSTGDHLNRPEMLLILVSECTVLLADCESNGWNSGSGGPLVTTLDLHLS